MLTAVFASVLALFYIYLSLRTIRLRRGKRIALGAGGDSQMERAIRVHSNFAEYVPLSLLLILMLELQSANKALVGFLGFLLLLGRCVHAYGVSQEAEDFRFRVGGMMLTFASLALASLANLAVFVMGSH
ncbi:MAPEG family protein [Methylocystis echinoides]|uniref:Glutathione metabolism protein n=1 Tax=Methylocystis echinoides TaxID=29468 RepID=A0A9W6LQS5_9HYPH|nr:MAPEG family protein [Methylocystis echinoides]GLI91687.1 hypothetical protein LMG27198_06790 [Methylocystis echinoides]